MFFSELAIVVAPRRRLRILQDDADNPILECALAGRAEAIVTGDQVLLALESFGNIPVATLRAYLGDA